MNLLLKQFGWVIGVLWIALIAAVNRAEYFGFHCHWVPSVLQNSLLYGSPVLLLVAAFGGDELKKQLFSAGQVFVIGVLLGCLYVAADDCVFQSEVQADLSVDQDRMRWWPLKLWALTSMDGDCYAFMD